MIKERKRYYTYILHNYISIYKYRKEILNVHYERWHLYDLTSDQEQGCLYSTSNLTTFSLTYNHSKDIHLCTTSSKEIHCL